MMVPGEPGIETRVALRQVAKERARQETKCADPCREGLDGKTCASPWMLDGDKLAVLMEEVGEVAREVCEARAERREPSPNLRVELIQVAAVAVAWAEGLPFVMDERTPLEKEWARG